MYTGTITQKGQVTIPLALREEFGLKPYGKARLEPGNGVIKIYAQEDILDMAGVFVPKNKKTIIKAREAFEKKYKRF